ncbi:MAG: hypothetical protein AAB664_03430 [Patescibacteria group bacterium]
MVRRSIQNKKIGTIVTSSQIVVWANEFLTDVMPHKIRCDANVISYRDGVLKIATKTGATNHFLRGFEDEMKNSMREKFHDLSIKQIFYLIKHNLDDHAL